MVRRNPLKALMIGTAVLIVVAIVALVAFDDDPSPTAVKAGPSRSTTTSTTIAEETTTTEPSATTTTITTPPTTRAGRPTTTRRAAPAPSTTAPSPEAVRAPAPGAYRYVEDGGGGGGPTHREYTLTITAAPDEGGATRRNVARDGAAEDEQAWAANAVRSLRQPGPSAPCTWSPPRTLYLGILSVGATWSIDSTCAKTTVQYPQTERHEAQYRVTGRDGANWVIHFTERYSSTESNSPTTQLWTAEGDMRFDAKRGLVVRRQETRTSHDLPGSRTVDTRLL